jgi:hypothetical protein
LEGLKGVEVIADDILVYGNGANEDEGLRNQNKNLHALFERLRSKNMKINESDIKLAQKELRSFAHILTGDGVKIDPDKTTAICNMSRPKNQADIHQILGLTTYLSKFLKNVSDVCEPLRQLMLKDKFQWLPEHERIFMRIKEMVKTAPVLRYFDPKEPVTIHCDSNIVLD